MPIATMSQAKKVVNVVPGLDVLLGEVARNARAAGVFGEVSCSGGRLTAAAARSAAPAEYRIDSDDGKVWVSLVTADRWLSQSIEADLVHTGDDLRSLIDEELVDQGETTSGATFQHFRSPPPDKLFTFRTPVPVSLGAGDSAGAVQTLTRYLLAYEACFRRLGDVDGGDDE